MLLTSAAFDGHRLDALADLQLFADDYRWVTKELDDFVNAHFQSQNYSTLEVGYDRVARGRSVAVHN